MLRCRVGMCSSNAVRWSPGSGEHAGFVAFGEGAETVCVVLIGGGASAPRGVGFGVLVAVSRGAIGRPSRSIGRSSRFVVIFARGI